MKIDSDEFRLLSGEIDRLKREKNAVIMAHYYQCDEIQAVADKVGDSLALAQYAATTDADVIVMCGVHFMAETAKILCPDKLVLVPDLKADCSLARSCEADDFARFIEQHPGHTVVSYVNTSAAVKALTDIVVTSGNAHKIINSLPQDEKIIFGPDRNLGGYINSVTGRDMLLWPGACHVHDRFEVSEIERLKCEHPGAKVLVHPECRAEVAALADKVGSTAALLSFARNDAASEFIVVTECGILYQMRKECEQKRFIAVGHGGEACNQCEFMKFNTLQKVCDALRCGAPCVEVDAAVAERARRPIDRMLELSK